MDRCFWLTRRCADLTTMKILKRLLAILLIVFALLCAFVIYFAFHPSDTERLSDFLYSRNTQATGTAGKIGNAASVSSGGKGSAGDGNNSEYIQPDWGDIHVPDNVSGRNGYIPIQEDRDEITEEEAQQLLNQLGVGETGEGLSFDPFFYPYYAMLSDTGKHMYRQIYANINALTPAFAPVEDIQADVLMDIFAAVFNDHPELFWVETGYYFKYRPDGKCVEIDLLFNAAAANLESARSRFEAQAEAIVSAARGMENDFEKEQYVHDALIQRTDYSLAADMNQTAYSALVNGRTVCAGYARAFQYMMQQLGIPCYYCTGYAGEAHAWNIVYLGDGFYNVDATWDDTDGGTYDYFNCTDQDYSGTHIRQELSVNLPPCNGQAYRVAQQAELQSLIENLRSLEELGFTPENVLHSLEDYTADCYRIITEKGTGTYRFSNVIDGDLWQDCLYLLQSEERYMHAYLAEAMIAVGASQYELSYTIELLKEGDCLVIHDISLW